MLNNRLRFLNEIAPNTKHLYQIVLRDFFYFKFSIKKKETRTPLNEGELNNLADQYFSEKRDFEEDIENFLINIKERPPKTIRLYLSIVKTFLVENDIELPEKYWRRIRGRIKGGKRTVDKPPTNEELKRIIMNMPQNGKALFLALASSGMRIGEALKIELDDVYLNENPVRIQLRGENTKNGDGRTVFISSEAKEQIMEYLKNRDNYLNLATKRSRFGKSTEDKRLFPFEDTTALVIWKGAIDKANLNGRDKSTNRYVFHPHVLRQFFRSRMSTIVPVDLIEELMGHSGYLTNEYRKHTIQELAKAYSSGESTVMIFGNIEKVTELKQEVENNKQQLQTIINSLATENVALKQRLSNVEEGWKKFETLYNDLVKFVGIQKAQEEIFKLDVEGHKRETKKERPKTKDEIDSERAFFEQAEQEEERQKNWEQARVSEQQ